LLLLPLAFVDRFSSSKETSFFALSCFLGQGLRNEEIGVGAVVLEGEDDDNDDEEEEAFLVVLVGEMIEREVEEVEEADEMAKSRKGEG
jgi:hypothetical protein